MRIYTYYTPVPGKSDQEEMALIECWKNSWHARGWDPVVLGERDVPNAKEYQQMLKGFRRQPTTMKPGLSYAWFCRWLAVAEQGGGFMCDYDVINYSFEPRAAGAMTVHAGCVPCLVSGTRDEYLRICELFAKYRADLKDRVGWRLDTSDMKILIRRQEHFIQTTDCIEYPHAEWDKASSVHYSNFAMKPRKFMPRHEWIPKLR